MRLLPAHLPDAKEMARSLCDWLEELSITSNCRDPGSVPPTLQQTQELMARAMGYGGWYELANLLRLPHEPVYLISDDRQRNPGMLEDFGLRLSRLLGYDDTEGAVLNAIGCSGAGYSPRARRALMEKSSPWGLVDSCSEIADGIRSVKTTSHGGLLLSKERQQAMPDHLRLDGGAYEADGEFYLVALAFPGEAPAMDISMRNALCYLDLLTPDPARTAHSRQVTELLKNNQGFLSQELPKFMETVLTAPQQQVISYLAECVLTNRTPFTIPPDDQDGPEIFRHPSLDDWTLSLGRLPTVDGKWPTRPGPWRRHWSAQARRADKQQAFEELMLREVSLGDIEGQWFDQA